MAGLFAARVLSDHFEEVILIDRDDIPNAPVHRGGVPQGKHFHVLLVGGLAIGEELFPGLSQDLEAAGAVRCVVGQDFFVFQPSGKSYALDHYQPEPRPSGVIYFMSRALLEHCVRRRVVAISNVGARDRSLVKAPLTDADRLVGVVLDNGEQVRADLVVDATGKNACSIQWLAALGFETPAESVIKCDFAYASALLKPPDPAAIGGAGFFVLPDPGGQYNTRASYLVRIEDDLWMAGLGGRFRDFPPVDLDGWRDFGRTLNWPIWDELVGTAELVTKPVPFRFPRSVRRHFERLKRFPDGLILLGDSVCHYNPVYGQGMSAAAWQARTLGELLAQRGSDSRGVTGLALEFFPKAYEVTRAPWALAAALDFQDNRTTGDFPVEEMESLAKFLALSTLADSDPEASRLAADLVTLTRPFSALNEPPWAHRLSLSQR
jgi:flavin-dependent dehydrogenase